MVIENLPDELKVSPKGSRRGNLFLGAEFREDFGDRGRFGLGHEWKRSAWGESAKA